MRFLGSGRVSVSLIGAAAALVLPATAAAHHRPPPPDGHLPAVQQNLELVGELEPTTAQGEIVPGQIADLAVHEGYAYLNSWDEPTCTKGGTYIVDINDPANPAEAEVDFLPAAPGYYHGEGAHVISVDTPQFQGDLLAVNDEPCTNDETRPEDVPATAGGFDLYNVTDPTAPELLVENAGDRSPDGSLVQDPAQLANSSHSVFVWQDGTRAFLVAQDNTELADVDIFDITDPTAPEFIADFDLFNLPQVDQIVDRGPIGTFQGIFHHDVVVKPVGGQMRMIVSYWDGGYVQLDVTDPANPTYITDTNFPGADPLTGFDPPEGNAHQAEYSHDNQLFLAADEDFAPERIDTVEITTGDHAGPYGGNSIGGAAPLDALPDGILNGPTVYGGYGCDASTAIPDRDTAGLPDLEAGEEAIVVLQRGPAAGADPEGPEDACFPGEKAENGIDAGYDAVLLVNHHAGEASGVSCGSGGFPATPAIVAACASHEAYHRIFDTEPAVDIPYVPENEPDVGEVGHKVSVDGSFDSWGYAHLYDANTSEELDAFAIPEALDPAFASGFGDLSIHEFATDPAENLAYSSYYSGGVRVFSFGCQSGITQTGAFIDEEGSNFWGIEQFTTPGGERLIAGSDRDFGLQIFRYTGPHPQAESCAPPDGGGAPPTPPAQPGDTDPPETTITKKPKKKSSSRRAKFAFASDEANARFECKLDRKRYKDCDSPYKKRVKPGKHKFKVRAIDAAGNVDPTPASHKWKVKKKGKRKGGGGRSDRPGSRGEAAAPGPVLARPWIASL